MRSLLSSSLSFSYSHVCCIWYRYCTVQLGHVSFKTELAKSTVDPVFEEEFVFRVSADAVPLGWVVENT